MTDSTQDNSETRQTLGREAFTRLLQSLSPDAEEAGRRYTRLHNKLVGFFNMKGLSDPVSAADETLDRAAIKINAGTPVSEVDKYCMGIARNLAKEKLRRTQRENSVFIKFVEGLADSSGEQVERIYRVLKPCFEQLTTEDQKLLLAYCRVIRGRARAEYRRQLAETMMTTVLALRVRVTRLRSVLNDCVKKLSNQD
jgi:DNA-directed RNA polymerase specialized sigma24 family protein